jgi:hypothetical protein
MRIRSFSLFLGLVVLLSVPILSFDSLTREMTFLYRAVQMRLAVEMRRTVLEKHFGIDMRGARSLSIGFNRKEAVGIIGKNLPARYIVEHQRVLFDPDSIEKPIPLDQFSIETTYLWSNKKHYVLRSLVDHELGHAYADLVSRQVGNGPWPDRKRTGNTKDPYRLIASRIVSEGIGGYFERASVIFKGDIVASDMRLGPMRGILMFRSGRYVFLGMEGQDFVYTNGYWLVKPILDVDVRRGVEYIVTHPFVMQHGRFVESAQAYQAQALRALSSPPSS